MKTIRSNCFETNSSSTHSITITTKNNANPTDDLVVNHKLLPERLVESWSFRSYGYADDSYKLTCSTIDQKASLFVHHLRSFCSWLPCEYDKSIASNAFNYAITELKKHCQYDDIDISFPIKFSHWSENGNSNSYIDDIFNNQDSSIIEQKILNHIINVIINDDAVILDDYESD